jgi:hypothetical protein
LEGEFREFMKRRRKREKEEKKKRVYKVVWDK